MFRKWHIRWRNKKSAKILGWKPEWFGAINFDNHLTKRIKKFQKKYNLKDDGICDALTYRMLVLKRHRFMKKIKAKKTNYNNG